MGVRVANHQLQCLVPREGPLLVDKLASPGADFSGPPKV